MTGILFRVEGIFIKTTGKPDPYLILFYSKDISEQEAKLQNKMDKICVSFPLDKQKPCPKIKIFLWNSISIAFTIDNLQPTTIFISNKMFGTLEEKEIEAIIAHEYGHLLYKAYHDEIKADSFAAKIAGKENIIKALQKTPSIMPFSWDYQWDQDTELKERVEALEK